MPNHYDNCHELSDAQKEVAENLFSKIPKAPLPDFGYLQEAAIEGQEEIRKTATLEDIEAYAKQYDEATAKVEAAEEALSEAKKALTKVTQHLIPEAFISLGLEKITLKDGRVFGYKEDVACSIKDYALFENFLEEQGDASILKTSLEVGKVPKPILKKMTGMLFAEFGVLVDPKQTCHAQTLAKYIRTLCGVGGETVATVALEELDPNMISVFTYYKTTVNTKRKKK